MSKWLPVLMMAGLVGLTSGCEDQAAAERAASRQDMLSVVKAFDRAEQGFVPAGQDNRPDTRNLQDYRQEELAKAREILEQKVQADLGSDRQRAAMRRLLATTQISASRYITRNTTNTAVEVANQGASLINTLQGVGNINALIISLDESAGSDLLKRLEQSLSDAQAQRNLVKDGVAKLESQIADLKKQVAQFEKTKANNFDKARVLREQAFIAEGQEQYDLYEQSSVAARASTEADREIQLRLVKVEALESELRVQSKQLDFAGTTVDSLEQQIQTAQKNQRETRTLRSATVDRKDKLAQKLGEDFQAVFQRYDTQVAAPYREAAETAGKAVTHLGKAAEIARSIADLSQLIKLETLAARMAQLNAMSHHLTASQGLGKTMSLIASQAVGLAPQQAEFFQANADKLEAEQMQLIDQAQPLLTAADGDIQSLRSAAGTDEQLTKAVEHFTNSLNIYREQFTAAK